MVKFKLPPKFIKFELNRMAGTQKELCTLKRDDAVIALVNQNDTEILFEFRHKQFASLIGLFAIGFGTAIWFFADQIKQSALWGYWF